MANLEKLRNIGISAHIDSGKTTLTERILFYTQKIHKIEEVKGKSGVGATMDSMDLEREKGITIQSACTYVSWAEHPINIIDTPGHVDFTIEVERALRVLDGAILVLCAVAGVQSQSITVDRQMRRYAVPRLAFINKMDRAGANAQRVMEQLREKLNHKAAFVTMPIGAEDKFAGVVNLVDMKGYEFHGDNGENVVEIDIPANLVGLAKEKRAELIATLADVDEEIGNLFLEEKEPTKEQLNAAIRRAAIALKFTPVFVGSAYKNKGVQKLLDGVVAYLPNPHEKKNYALDQTKSEEKVELSPEDNKPLVALAFKLEDGRYGQLTYMRIYQGKIAKGDFVTNMANQKKVKVPRVVRMHADQMNDVNDAGAGDIVALFGVECSSGDTFTDGSVKYTMTSMHVPDAVISLAVKPKDKAGEQNFSKALNRFSKEDPTFRVHRDEESNETIISGMGELHLDIYIERIKREFNCEVIAGKPQVAYRETIAQKATFNYTHKKQTGGRGQFARVAGYLEPLPSDAIEQFEFVDDITGGSIPREFIPATEKGFREAIQKGSLANFQVVGVRVVIDDGAAHDVDSSEQAFKTAALMGFREGYAKAKPVVMEPVMKVEVRAPTEFQGAVVGQLNQRRGIIESTETADGYVTAVALVPLAAMFGYSTDLRSATQGKGEFTMEFSRYSTMPRNEQDIVIAEAAERAKQQARA
jgi:elongation factor G